MTTKVSHEQLAELVAEKLAQYDKELGDLTVDEFAETMDVLYELATSLVDDPARFGDPDDVLCWGFSLPPDLDPEAIIDHRRAALAALCDEWPWLRSILPMIKAACESPEPDPASDPVVMGPTVSQQPLPLTAGGRS